MARAAAKKVKPRKRLTGDERRESILEAALGCFLEKGYIATTINDIREASGATTGSIYHFFDGKGALAMALLEDAVAGWSGESTATSETPEAVIKASAGGLVSWGLKNPELFRFTDEIRTLAVTAPEFAGIADTLAEGQGSASASYSKFLKAKKVKDLPWPVAHSMMLGPAYNFLRLATTGRARVAAKRAVEIFADAAWAAVKA
ncbi:MAG: TetR/AcrR family transcriptional regulator [Devosia nanyangense]|jgi:AcrR family transcriptional regulator|uniref:TetR/AcrR family transcriptional regulator n=1 Tax=Devosia nanyangense TaxID=1228055 RepID=A0A933KZI1_9HYPH|nr:TetR/AcrR family transcriptional regulator [Devosia nanyangense]